MSEEVTNEEVVEESQDENLTPEIGSENSPADDATKTETSSDDAQADEFDPAAVEAAFGMPAGALADCKDQESALEAVRDYTDKTLIAGLGFNQAPTSQRAEEQPKGEKKETSGNPEIDALRAELKEVKSTIQKQNEQYTSQLSQQLESRIAKEIDSWQSPKYGVGDSRNYRQVKAVKELEGMLKTHIAGLQATGKPLSQIEPLLRRVRAFDDDTYTPAKPKASGKALGTPGGAGKAGGGPGDKKGPANIHEALMGNRN